MRQVSLPQSPADIRAMMALAQEHPIMLQDDTEETEVVVMSKEDYDLTHKALVEDLLELCDEMREEAEANGLTEDILEEILSNT